MTHDEFAAIYALTREGAHAGARVTSSWPSSCATVSRVSGSWPFTGMTPT